MGAALWEANVEIEPLACASHSGFKPSADRDESEQMLDALHEHAGRDAPIPTLAGCVIVSGCSKHKLQYLDGLLAESARCGQIEPPVGLLDGAERGGVRVEIVSRSLMLSNICTVCIAISGVSTTVAVEILMPTAGGWAVGSASAVGVWVSASTSS